MLDPRNFQRQLKTLSSTNIETGFTYASKLIKDLFNSRNQRLVLALVLGAINGLNKNHPENPNYKINIPDALTRSVKQDDAWIIVYNFGKFLTGKEKDFAFDPNKLPFYNEKVREVTDRQSKSIPSLPNPSNQENLFYPLSEFITGFMKTMSRIHNPNGPQNYTLYRKSGIVVPNRANDGPTRSNFYNWGSAYANEVSSTPQRQSLIFCQIASRNRLDLLLRVLDGVAGQNRIQEIEEAIWQAGQIYRQNGLHASLSLEKLDIFSIPFDKIQKFLDKADKTERFFIGFVHNVKPGSFPEQFVSDYSYEASLGRTTARQYSNDSYSPSPTTIIDMLHKIVDTKNSHLLLTFLDGVASRPLQNDNYKEIARMAGTDYRNHLLANHTFDANWNWGPKDYGRLLDSKRHYFSDLSHLPAHLDHFQDDIKESKYPEVVAFIEGYASVMQPSEQTAKSKELSIQEAFLEGADLAHTINSEKEMTTNRSLGKNDASIIDIINKAFQTRQKER